MHRNTEKKDNNVNECLLLDGEAVDGFFFHYYYFLIVQINYNQNTLFW